MAKREINLEKMLRRSMAKPPKVNTRVPAKAANVSVPLSAERLDAIDAWRARRKLSRAEAIDDLLCRALRSQDVMDRMRK